MQSPGELQGHQGKTSIRPCGGEAASYGKKRGVKSRGSGGVCQALPRITSRCLAGQKTPVIKKKSAKKRGQQRQIIKSGNARGGKSKRPERVTESLRDRKSRHGNFRREFAEERNTSQQSTILR